MVGAADATANRYWLRGKWNTAISGWVEMLTSGNYNSFSPTLTGTGASGTWAINVTGTAGSISGFNNPAVAATANTIVYRDGSGHIYGGYILGSYFNASAGNSENPTIGQIWTQNTTDNYLRKSTPAHFRSQVTDGSYPSLTGANASGTWSINVTGNAGTATTAVSATSLANFTNQSGARYTTDFNSIVTTGFFNAEATPTNSPGGSYGQLISVKGIDTGLQIYGGYVNDNLWFRGWHTSGGTFTAWRTIIHSGNIASQTVTSCTGNAATATALTSMNISQFTNNSGYLTSVTIANGSVTLAKIENITAYTILGNSNASSAATPAALSVATVATMLSGQTMNINGSSTSCSGNAATATNATTVGGLLVQTGTNYEANKIVRTDGNGFVNVGWINTISGDNGTTALNRIYASEDAYLRYYTPANFRAVLDVPTRNGTGVTNFGINTAPSNRLHINGDNSNPSIRVDNGAVVLAAAVASNGRGFYGWLPISIGGTTKWIQLYNT